jgi:flagellar biosynthesis/type III secretory pathway protein FliH
VVLPRGRIVKAGFDAAKAKPYEISAAPSSVAASAHAGRRIARQVVEATLSAAQKLEAAEAHARTIIEEAENAVRQVREGAAEEGRRAAAAELAAAWARLRAAEAAEDERNIGRIVDLARALAERVLAESLRIEPVTVLAIARQVLASARQARRITLRAHPDDAEVLRREIASLGLEETVLEIHADGDRPRGCLFLDTDLGILDANLPLQLDRLTRALRDSFRS